MIETIWKKIIRRKPLSLWIIPAIVLFLISLPYRLGLVIKRSFVGGSVKLSTPVISIGNITVGGSGKTPIVCLIARDLINDGFHVGIVSSGYGRINNKQIIAPGYKIEKMDVADTSDEVMLLAKQLPEAMFSIEKSKSEAASILSESNKVDIILVDDGFQHFKLSRDIDIVTYDAGLSKSLLKIFPYGMLREPKSSLKRADIIIITRAKFALDLSAIKRQLKSINPEAEIYHAGFSAENLIGTNQTLPIKYLEDKSVFLFAGVGNFRALKKQVTALCSDLDYALELQDHQRYDNQILTQIKNMADKHNSDLILTTFKDWVKLSSFDFGREIYYLDMTVDLDPGEEKLLESIKQRLKLKLDRN